MFELDLRADVDSLDIAPAPHRSGAVCLRESVVAIRLFADAGIVVMAASAVRAFVRCGNSAAGDQQERRDSSRGALEAHELEGSVDTGVCRWNFHKFCR